MCRQIYKSRWWDRDVYVIMESAPTTPPTPRRRRSWVAESSGPTFADVVKGGEEDDPPILWSEEVVANMDYEDLIPPPSSEEDDEEEEEDNALILTITFKDIRTPLDAALLVVNKQYQMVDGGDRKFPNCDINALNDHIAQKILRFNIKKVWVFGNSPFFRYLPVLENLQIMNLKTTERNYIVRFATYFISCYNPDKEMLYWHHDHYRNPDPCVHHNYKKRKGERFLCAYTLALINRFILILDDKKSQVEEWMKNYIDQIPGYPAPLPLAAVERYMETLGYDSRKYPTPRDLI